MKSRKKIVLSIIVVLLSFVVLETFITPRVRDKPRDRVKETIHVMSRLMTTLQIYKKDHGQYPTQKEGLKSLYQFNKSGKTSYVNPEKEFFVDDWDGDIIYLRIGEECQLISHGENYEEGGLGPYDGDIILNSKEFSKK